jgi:hypothetical protein
MTVSIAGTLILNSDIIVGDEVRVESSGLVIPIARDLIDTIYSCPTKSFLCQNGKSPTIKSTQSNISIISGGVIDGVGKGFPAFTGPGANSSLIDSQNDPCDIYGANHAGIGTVSDVPGTLEFLEEYYTIHDMNIIQGGVDLNYTPIGNIAVNIVHGPAQVYETDFIVIGDFISWEGRGLGSVISSGDVIRVIYEAYTGRNFPSPKPIYGSYKAPTSIGSGSGEASGGSGITLSAPNGMVNISGIINVSGENGHSNRTGGGSGGSVWIDSYNIQGAGSIYAEGGDASYAYAGGGGGGYITMNYENLNVFSGITSVLGHKGGSKGLITVEKREPFFTEKFTGTILNTKWWEVVSEPVALDNAVRMDTTTSDFRSSRLESKFQISGKNIQIDCDFLPTGFEPSYHTSYFQMFLDDRNWVQVARKHNNIFGMYTVDGFLSQSAQPYPYTDTIFRIVKTDSTFTLQYLDSSTGPQTIVSDVIPDFQSGSFKVAFGTIKEEPDSSNYITDYFKLTNIDEANGYVTLSSLPVDASNVTLNVIGGGAQIYGHDYTVSGQSLYWNPVNLNLLENDEIIVQYPEDSTFNDLQIAWDNFKVYSGIMRDLETTRPIIYVDPIYGSDSSDGGPITPLQNLFVATAWAKRGGTVVLYSGTYNPTEVEGKSLTIMGANGSTAIITAANAQDTTGSNWENSCLTFSDCQGKVSNLYLTGAREGVFADEVQNLEITGCQIHDVTTAVKFTSYTKDCQVGRNTIYDASVGIDFGFQNYNPFVYSNVMHDCSCGARISDGSNFKISSNTFDGLETCVIVDSSSVGFIASNNMTNSTVGANIVDVDSTVGFFNNNYYATTTAVTGLGTITDTSSIATDPGYANQYLKNYHLLFFSTDRSTGTGQFDQMMIDRDGVERANDPSYDIGAYRFIDAVHSSGSYYVDTSGNDNLNTGEKNSPYRTLDKAMSVADSSVIVTGGHLDTYYLKLKSQNVGLDASSFFIYPGNEYVLYYHTVDSSDVSRGFFYLPANVELADNVAVNILHGPTQFYGTDFIIQAQPYAYPKIYWTGLGLDGLIGVGDVVRVLFKEGPLFKIHTVTLHGQYSDLNLGRAIYVSPNGSDSTVMGGDGTNSGGNGTFDKPYRSITWALAQSTSGDHLVVIPGDYELFNGLDNRIIVPCSDRTSVADGRMYFEDLFNTAYTMYPNHNLSGVSWDLDTTATSEIEVVEGYLRMSYDGTHPVTATSLFDFSPIGTDRTVFEVSAELRQAFDPIFFSVYNGPNVATFRVNHGDYTCSLLTGGVLYSCHGELEAGTDTTDNFFTEYVCISSSDIENKFFNLSFMIEDSSEVVINVIGGTSQELGTDFYVLNNMIKWDGMGLDGQVRAGDVLRVIYVPHGLSAPYRVKFVLSGNKMTVMGMVDGHYEKLMKRAMQSPITGAWNTSFYMNTVEHTNASTGRGYVSRYLAIAESFGNTDLAQPYEYKIWRQPVVLHG